ncbi:Hypothetical predicted protein [Octopus vulgaris]|uniref:Uncharacterized protein n=1 Tax=Octopus vulgaris TaxID=6645 RepID=A0AA36AT97_OCTVU|nr:Hypothetical predicted protein [Octopus vulgaris]
MYITYIFSSKTTTNITDAQNIGNDLNYGKRKNQFEDHFKKYNLPEVSDVETIMPVTVADKLDIVIRNRSPILSTVGFSG